MTLTTVPSQYPFANVSWTRMAIRHVVACHVENLLEGARENGTPANLLVSDLASNSLDSIWGDGMWKDYCPRKVESYRAAEALLKRSFSKAAVEREARWMLKQNLATVARFVATGNPGELTESGERERDRHLEFMRRLNGETLVPAAAKAQNLTR